MDLDEEENQATREANGANRHKGNMEEDIKILKEILHTYNLMDYRFGNMLTVKQTNAIENILVEFKKKDKIIEEIKEYANWHIDCCTEDIADYIDDDKIENAHIIGEFKEQREHWRDILRIIDNEKTYINYKNY